MATKINQGGDGRLIHAGGVVREGCGGNSRCRSHESHAGYRTCIYQGRAAHARGPGADDGRTAGHDERLEPRPPRVRHSGIETPLTCPCAMGYVRLAATGSDKGCPSGFVMSPAASLLHSAIRRRFFLIFVAGGSCRETRLRGASTSILTCDLDTKAIRNSGSNRLPGRVSATHCATAGLSVAHAQSAAASKQKPITTIIQSPLMSNGFVGRVMKSAMAALGVMAASESGSIPDTANGPRVSCQIPARTCSDARAFNLLLRERRDAGTSRCSFVFYRGDTSSP